MSAIHAITELQAGKDVIGYREGGNSMTPIIKSRQPVTLRPIVDPTKLRKRDIVLVRVGGNVYTHLIKAVSPAKVQIGNNHGRINGWAPFDNVYGIVTEIDGTSRRNSQYS